jgi:hypothetical protein
MYTFVRFPHALVPLSVLVYVVSLFLPAVVYNTGLAGNPDLGYEILLQGWLGVFQGIVAWYANCLFLFGLLYLYLRMYKLATYFSLFALALGLQSLFFSVKYLDESGVNTATVDHLGPGFYLWMLSFALLAIGSAALYRRTKTPSDQAPRDAAAT